MEIDVNTMIGVLGLLVAGSGVYAAIAWQRIKTAFGLFVAMFNQDNDLLNAVNLAIADDKITEEEFRAIYKEFHDSYKATMELIQQFR